MRIHHCGVKVRDVEKAMDFYTRVLGLKLMETVTIAGQNFYFVGDGSMMLEIEPAYDEERLICDHGFGHLALAVDDLEAYCQGLRKHEVVFLMEPSQFIPTRKIAFIQDPEGNAIQLIEFINTHTDY
ncbi:MAG TPA: VOC family protein [Syntrophomonadaceae bacterium]|jgi:lactoylglutathione lyase|nr:VOC family protein [Syntrophomonadaceae bacterium]HRX20515.1 VOC family protein [Syntrophomonadaceae bacterium]